jgi:uncharacterized protein YceK
MDAKGNLYGTTALGGKGGHCSAPLGEDCGTVFELTPPVAGESRWTETVLYRFDGSTDDGAEPKARLIMDVNGALYGTTSAAGTGDCIGGYPYGCGTVFELTPPTAGETHWTERVLHRFKGQPTDGGAPLAGLIMDANGALYGTTAGGGAGHCDTIPPDAPGCGTVFMLTPPAPGTADWRETILHTFRGGADGADPEAGLIMDANGTLYGTTALGGAGCPGGGCGTVFMLTPPAAGETRWAENILYRFRAGADGAVPYGGLSIDANGILSGTTSVGGGGGCKYGCGTVFELSPPAAGETRWTENILHRFAGGTDGDDPEAGLIMDASGALYGTAYYGGGGNGCSSQLGCGTVFKVVP